MFNKCVFHAYYVQSFSKVRKCVVSKNNSILEHNLRFLLQLKKAELNEYDAKLTYYMS